MIKKSQLIYYNIKFNKNCVHKTFVYTKSFWEFLGCSNDYLDNINDLKNKCIVLIYI